MLLAVSLVACGGAGGDSSDANATPSSQLGTATLGAAGGVVQSTDQQLQVQADAGALVGPTTFTVTKLEQISGLPEGYALVPGSAYEVDWDGAGFAEGAGVTLRFKTAASASQALRVTAQGVRFISDAPPPPSAVVHCASDSTQVVAIVNDPNGGYGSTQAILCNPVASGGTHHSNSQVGTVQPVPPTVTTAPADVTAIVGATATFHVVAQASHYQWLRNGVDIAGATGDSYSLVVAQGDNGARFSVRLTNGPLSVTTASATLTVGLPPPPATPLWQKPVDLSGYIASSDLPQIGSMAGYPFTVWSDSGLLASDFPGLSALKLAVRARLQVLTGPNLGKGYIVFVDDDGTSQCNTGFGNRLSAVAVGWSIDRGAFAPSSRLTLYQSSGDCIGSFATAMTLDDAKRSALVFTLQELNSGQIKVGTAAVVTTNTNPVSWTWSQTAATTLTRSSACTQAYGLTAEGMRGTLQASLAAGNAVSNATVAWVANQAGAYNLCSATYANGGWSPGAVVFNQAQRTEPVVAMDRSGNTLIAGSRVVDLNATPARYAMTAAYRPGSGAPWALQALDASSAAALPMAAFDTAGNAFMAWRPATSGTSTIYQTRRTAAGNWETVQALSQPQTDTRYPRLCVADDGQALLLYETYSTASSTFQVVDRRWKDGQWSAEGPVQDNTSDGRYADCPRNVTQLRDMGLVWRETNPNNPAQFRVMYSSLTAY